MNRRQAIQSMGLISFHGLYPTVLNSFLVQQKTVGTGERKFLFFTAKEQVFVKEVIDIIIPQTNTKSASDAGVHFFLDQVFASCLTDDQKLLIRQGLSDALTQWKNNVDKVQITKALDTKAFSGDENAAWFKTLKQYTMIGYFTSEEGTTKAGDYQKIPDRYVGEISIDEHTRAHGKTSLRFNL
jgi:gluconate 2-dehydrogenase gamma chain